MSHAFTWRRWTVAIQSPPYGAAVSGQGTVCEGGSDYRRRLQYVSVYDAASAATPRTLEAPGDWSFVDHSGVRWSAASGNRPCSPRRVAWSPDGQHVVSAACNPERALRLFDASTGYVECFGGHGGDIADVAWSRRGRFLASTSTWSRHQLKLWRPTPTEGGLRILPVTEIDHTHDYLPWWKHEWMSDDFYGFGKLSFSPDERWLATEIQLRNDRHRVAVYAVPDFDDCFTFPLPVGAGVEDLTWDPEGRCVWAAAGTHGLFVLGPLTDDRPSFTHRHPGHATRCEVSPCGRFSAVVYRTSGQEEDDAPIGTYEIQLSQLPDFRTVARLRGISEVRSLAWSADGRDFYALTIGADVLHCRISDAP